MVKAKETFRSQSKNIALSKQYNCEENLAVSIKTFTKESVLGGGGGGVNFHMLLSRDVQLF